MPLTLWMISRCRENVIPQRTVYLTASAREQNIGDGSSTSPNIFNTFRLQIGGEKRRMTRGNS